MMLLLKLLMIVLVFESVPTKEARIRNLFKEAHKTYKYNERPLKTEKHLVLSSVAVTKEHLKDIAFKKVNWKPDFGTLSKKGKLLPKKNLSSYFLYQLEEVPKLRAASAEMTQVEATKKAAAGWKTLGDAERQPFVDKCQKDLERYQDQSEQLKEKGYFMLPDGRKSSDVRIPEAGDPAPKSPRSAYLYFSAENNRKLKADEGISMTEAAKKSAKQWEGMSAEARSPYVEKYTADRKRFDKAMAEFGNKGYFTLSDGTKSYELNKKKK